MAGNPKLTVLFEKMRGKTFELNKDEMTVGRKDGVDICIKDASLSGFHATISQRDGENGKKVFYIKDNDSTNGTRVNNVPVTEQELKTSDVILFGGVEVLFDSGEDDSNANYSKHTHTIDISGIDSKIATAPTLTNLNPFAGKEEKKHAMQQKVFIAIVAAVGLAVVGLMVFVILKIVGAM